MTLNPKIRLLKGAKKIIGMRNNMAYFCLPNNRNYGYKCLPTQITVSKYGISRLKNCRDF